MYWRMPHMVAFSRETGSAPAEPRAPSMIGRPAIVRGRGRMDAGWAAGRRVGDGKARQGRTEWSAGTIKMNNRPRIDKGKA